MTKNITEDQLNHAFELLNKETTGGGIKKRKKRTGIKQRSKMQRKTKTGRRRNLYMYVARGKLAKTAGGVDASGITVLKKKDGSKKYVSTSRRKNALHNRWIQAGKLARKELKTENKFMPFKKGTPLYNKTKQIYNDLNQKWEGARVKAAKNVSTASKKKSLSPSGKLLLGSPWWKSTLKIYNKSVPK